MSKYRYVLLGCGRQGTAAAYDLAIHGDAREIVFADVDLARAMAAVEWVKARVPSRGRPVTLTAMLGNAANQATIVQVLRGADAAISAVPYRFNLDVTQAAVEAGVSLCDLGGHPETTKRQLELAGLARRAGMTIVPDCGQAPGMATSLMVAALEMVAKPETLDVWDGGLPLDPVPPLYYRLTFAIEGLTNEYDGPCYNIRNGAVVALDALTEEQTVEFPPPLGRLEAFVASGTGSTVPWTFQSVLEEFTSRVVRHPGHLAVMKMLKTLGFFSLEGCEVDGRRIVPRHVTEALLEPLLVGDAPIRDMVVVRAHCTGREDLRRVQAEVDLVVSHDLGVGLTAMQRCTGFDAAIVAAMLARGHVAKGVAVRERSIDVDEYVRELGRRGINVTRRLRIAD